MFSGDECRELIIGTIHCRAVQIFKRGRLLEWDRAIQSGASVPDKVVTVWELVENCECGSGTVRERRRMGPSAVGNRCQRTAEDTAD